MRLNKWLLWLGALALSGCAYAQQFVPLVEFPAVRNVAKAQIYLDGRGFHWMATNMVIQNGVPVDGTAEIIAFGTVVAVLEPGQTAFDNRRIEFHNPEIPLTALFRDRGGRFIGAAFWKFRISGDRPESHQWIIRPEEVLGPDGQNLNYGWGGAPNYPYPPVNLGVSRVEIRKIWWNATAGIQVVNVSHFDWSFLTNGQGRVQVPAEGGFRYAEDKFILGYGSGVRRTIQGTWLHPGGFLIRSQEFDYSVPSQGIYGYQLIIGPQQASFR